MTVMTPADIKAARPACLPDDGLAPIARARTRREAAGQWSGSQMLGRRWAIGCVALEITQRCNLDCTLCYQAGQFYSAETACGRWRVGSAGGRGAAGAGQGAAAIGDTAMKWARVSVILALGLAGCTTLRVAPLPSVVADDGAAWAQVLQRSVDGMGQVDFRGLQAMPQALERAVALVGETRPEKLPSDAARITFHLNAYNLLAMFNVVRSGIPERLSLEDRVRFFKLTSVVGGRGDLAL